MSAHIHLRAGHSPTRATDPTGRPLALASGDLDEDGVPDLIVASGESTAGILTIHRGNPEAIYGSATATREVPHARTTAPFPWPPRVVTVPVAPEFMGTGDFDGDGHLDVVVASRTTEALFLLLGDGTGALGPVEEIKLPGRVTALTTGEANRRDGLADLAVGIIGAQGPAVHLFESPAGALHGDSEAYPAPAAATALVLGQLDDGPARDLAIAAGNQLLIVQGRDRKLSLKGLRRAESPDAVIKTVLAAPSEIVSMTAGDLMGDGRADLALLLADGRISVLQDMQVLKPLPDLVAEDALLVRAAVSSLPRDELLVVERDLPRLRVLKPDRPDTATVEIPLEQGAAAVAALTMRLNADALDDLLLLEESDVPVRVLATVSSATFTVNSTGDTSDANTTDGVCDDGNGKCTLRAAIEQANAIAGADSIVFSIGSGVQTLQPATALPAVTEALTIDGTTQPGFDGTPIIVLDGSLAGFPADGLNITADNCTVRGLVIHSFVGGTNGAGIKLGSDGNIVEGNYIGTDVTGHTALENTYFGVRIVGFADNTVGGATAAARNLISGNDSAGVYIEGAAASGNVVEGNFIGTDATGAAQLSTVQQGAGVKIVDSSDNTVGGTSPGTGNVLSGNQFSSILGAGVVISGAATGNLVQGNFIGTDLGGSLAVPNYFAGVVIEGASGNTVGGTTSMARNVISGNGDNGIAVRFSGSTGNLIQGNFIGTDSSGSTAVPNHRGVWFDRALYNTIGGITSGARNVISGNNTDSNSAGVEIYVGEGNQIAGNFIGTDSTGTASVPNLNGVELRLAAIENDVGGMIPEARNVISGNQGHGVEIIQDANGNWVQGNYIGTDVSGSSELGNGGYGVAVYDSLYNAVGGPASGAGNVIAFSGLDGVYVGSGAGNTVMSNSIRSNAGLGIDLSPDGPTPNDPGDADTGPNDLQNYPPLTSTASGGVLMYVTGTLDSAPSSPFILEFFSSPACDSSGHGEGETFLDGAMLFTDGTGFLAFTIPLAGTPPEGHFITATATDASGNTSEFSACRIYPDCNGNDVLDALDIANLTSPDCDENGIPDECEADEDSDGVIDACDNCPDTPNAGQLDDDSDGFGAACECDDSIGTVYPGAPQICDGLNNDCGDPSYPSLDGTNEADPDSDGLTECTGDCEPLDPAVYPGATESNDGLDNQCPGDPGFGLIDEISGDALFVTATGLAWPAQPGATRYEVARSPARDFSAGCVNFVAESASFDDTDEPASGQAFHYLVRPLDPFPGSWGMSSEAVERIFTCANETLCADGVDNDLDGATDCDDPDCLPDAVCQPELFTFTDTYGDDITEIDLYLFFDSIGAGADDYVFVEFLEADISAALCLSRADFYRGSYLDYAGEAYSVSSGTWEKWHRSYHTAGDWIRDDGSYPNLYGSACGYRFSWCMEWGLGGTSYLAINPALVDQCELNDATRGCYAATALTLKVGPSRLSACGF